MTRVEAVLKALNFENYRVRGGRAWILCPNCPDDRKATNFFIRVAGERAGQFKCFACGAGGGLRAFVMLVRKCDEKQASDFVRTLGVGQEAPKAAFSVVRLPPVFGRRTFRLPPEVIQKPLAEWVSGAKEYAERRGITAEEVARYKIGYAVDARLAGRIVFPVIDPKTERVVSYSARTFVDDEVRYLTPHESEGADIDAFFGAQFWPPVYQRDVLVVLEGAINKLAFDRVVDVPSGSLSGSDLRLGHVLAIGSFKRVVVLVDSDPAGDKVAVEIRASLGPGIVYSRVQLPDGQDPASLAPEHLYECLPAYLQAHARHH